MARGINSLYLALISSIFSDYTKEALILNASIRGAKRSIKKQLNKKAAAQLLPIINDYFTRGIAASNKLVKQELAILTDVTKIPFKYNKDIIDTFNDKSVFTGYYDKNYKSLYSKREIDNLKRVILQGKYNNLPAEEIRENIMRTINISKNRALVTARMETQRLEGAVQNHVYQNPKVKEKYEKVWKSEPGARPSHASMNGQVADKDGYFTDSGGNKVLYPPPTYEPFNCRCKSLLRLRK